MTWSYSPNQEDAEDIINGGFKELPEGYYHGFIEDVLDTATKNGDPMIEITVKILAGTVKNCKGMKKPFYFLQNEYSLKELIRLLIATKMLTPEDVRTYGENNKPIPIETFLPELPDRQFCFRVRKFTKKDGKEGIGYTFYSIDSVEAADIPKDLEVVKLLQNNSDNSIEDVF
ncbi:MAG: hypothetical protein LBK82_09360 [Planctomycetaceae bacterium]|jgi:hypothetical protein|nr:hypothetical protein [Planctomycetaceae bacterium]